MVETLLINLIILIAKFIVLIANGGSLNSSKIDLYNLV